MMPKLDVIVTASDQLDSDEESTSTLDVSQTTSFGASGLADGFNAVYTITAKTSGLTVDFADGNLEEVTNPVVQTVQPVLEQCNSQPIYHLRFISSGRTSDYCSLPK